MLTCHDTNPNNAIQRKNHPTCHQTRFFFINIDFDPLHFGVAFNHGKKHFVARNRGPAMSWLQGSKETWRCGASEGGCCLSVDPTDATYYDFELFIGEKHQKTGRRNLVNKVFNDIFLVTHFCLAKIWRSIFLQVYFGGIWLKLFPSSDSTEFSCQNGVFQKENKFSQTLGCIFLGDFRGAKNLEGLP